MFMGVSTCLTLVLLIFRFLKRSWTNSIPRQNRCSLSTFQWLVRHVSGAHHLGLWASTCPVFYGRKVLLLFLTTSFLLHRKMLRQWFFLSILDTLGCMFLYVCSISYVMNAALLLMFWRFSPFILVSLIHTSLLPTRAILLKKQG